MVIERIAARAAELTGAYGVTGQRPELVDAVAIAMARCTLINHELELFTRFCYQKQGERYINLRSNSQIPRGVFTPWGSKGKLTRTEGDTVRRYLLSLRRPSPLYFYADTNRRWFVNTAKYPTLEWALEWCNRFAMTPEKWLEFVAE